jgi:cytoskeleton protein RodZ
MSDRPSVAADAAQPANEPVGVTLARVRQAAGLSLEEAARQLKFAPRQLDALERGEFNRLPGGAAVRGMLRSYARLLRLDPEALVARVGSGVTQSDAERLAQRFRQPVPFSDGSRRSNLAYIALSVALLVVVAAVVFQWQQERAGAARLTFVSAAQQPAEPAGVTVARAGERRRRPRGQRRPRLRPRLRRWSPRPPRRRACRPRDVAASRCSSRANPGSRSRAAAASCWCRSCMRAARSAPWWACRRSPW